MKKLTKTLALCAISALVAHTSATAQTTPQTHASPTPVFNTTPTYFYGVLLEHKPDSVDKVKARALALCDRMDNKTTCLAEANEELQKLDTTAEHRALALGTSAAGYGYRAGDTSPDMAWLRALYNCNHVENNPKLCEVAGINVYETASLYDLSKTQGQSAIVALQANTPSLPSGIDFADESRDFGLSSLSAAETLQSTELLDYSKGSPVSLADIKTWSTAALLAAYRQSGAGVRIIDVSNPLDTMLPNALHILNAGVNTRDVQQNAAIQTRLGNILSAAYPDDKTSPLIFYCTGVTCPVSSLAALRAVALGYTQVGWYRGGKAAWVAAGLPVVQKVPHAIVW